MVPTAQRSLIAFPAFWKNSTSGCKSRQTIGYWIWLAGFYLEKNVDVLRQLMDLLLDAPVREMPF